MGHMATSKYDPLADLSKQIKGSSLRKTARKHGISAAYLSEIMTGKKAPGPKILDSLGVKRVVRRTVSYSL